MNQVVTKEFQTLADEGERLKDLEGITF